jgi:hypothetical protein
MLRAIWISGLTSSFVVAVWGQTAAPNPGRPTDRPDPAVVARLKSAPPLRYAVDPNWPQLPKGYNFGECTGVDVDRQGTCGFSIGAIGR